MNAQDTVARAKFQEGTVGFWLDEACHRARSIVPMSRMSPPVRLSDDQVSRFLSAHAGWAVEEGRLVRTFVFASYAAGVAFTVALAMEADKRDHHPDLFLGFRKVRVSLETHDAGGLSALDLALAEHAEGLVGGSTVG